MTELAVLAGFVLAFGLVSDRIRHWPLTGPMIFVAFGLLIGPDALDLVTLELGDEQVLLLAEATLAVILFADAARIDLGAVRRHAAIPLRLLLVGLPLTIGLGTLVIRALLGVPWTQAALLAAILAPTDAALGQAVVTNERVPSRVRAALNVESGLNDGMALPAVTLFLAISIAEVESRSTASWLRFLAEQIGYGTAVGIAVGALGGWLLASAGRRGWMDGAAAQLAALALVGLGYAIAELVGGNAFIAAFVTGLAFDRVAPREAELLTEFAEDLARLLALVTFVIFGNALVGPALPDATVGVVVCAALTLSVGRMVPVAVSLVGTRLRRPTVAFLGWFGPRGLASVVFGLVVLEEAGFEAGDEVFSVVALTVVGSVVAHGVTAAPLSERYADWYDRHRAGEHDGMAETATEADAADMGGELRIRWAPGTDGEATQQPGRSADGRPSPSGPGPRRQ